MEKVRGQNHTVKASFTRPNDTNGYVSGDVINDSTSAPTVLTFAGAAREDGASIAGGAIGPGIIQGAVITSSANQATKLECELWLFDTTVTPDNDNAAFTPSDAENNTLVGIIPFPASSWKSGDATAGAGGNALCDVNNLGIPFNAVGGRALFGVLVARGAYTPVAQEAFQIRLKILD